MDGLDRLMDEKGITPVYYTNWHSMYAEDWLAHLCCSISTYRYVFFFRLLVVTSYLRVGYVGSARLFGFSLYQDVMIRSDVLCI